MCGLSLERRRSTGSPTTVPPAPKNPRLAAFRYALRQFLHFSEEAAKGVGLTPPQHQALLAIKGFPDRDRVMIGELAERLQIRHHSAVGPIDWRRIGPQLSLLLERLSMGSGGSDSGQ